MSIGPMQKALERLEWPRVLSLLADSTRTPAGRRRFAPASIPERDGGSGFSVFENSLEGVHARLAATDEARALLDAGLDPPLGGIRELAEALLRAAKGGVLSPGELREVGSTLAALRATARFAERHREIAPLIAGFASPIVDSSDLIAEIERCIDANGEVSDAASPTLADARRESHRLASEIQQRAERYIRDPDTVSNLSDSYYTVRNDRFVLPVRADARSSIRGIVHDASNSGTTVFIEPEALVDLNNRRKRAEIAIEQEVLRILRELSRRTADAAPEIEAGIAATTEIDCAFARGRLSQRLDARRPEVGSDGIVRLPQLRHPLLDPEEVVPNDVGLGDGITTLVISGPNAGGKTVCMKAVAMAALFARAGLHVPAGEGARIDFFEEVLADIGDEQDIREHLSTFSAHMANLAQIVDRATEKSLVILDEVGVGTDPGEGAALAQAILEKLADAGARTIATTHYNLLKELAESDERFSNASVEFDPETLEPTYRLRTGFPGTSSAAAVAARMGLHSDVLDRANQILDREDRQLDHMLSELAASRAALEREQLETARIREETEGVRDLHRAKLERLQQRRDDLYQTMRKDLDRIFGDAHAQVAAVIRDLQRGGRAQDAAHARERLLALEERARSNEVEAAAGPETEPARDPVDWQRAHAGDPVTVDGAGRGVLDSLPDRRGRVAVRVGSARLQVARERVHPAEPEQAPATRRRHISVESASMESGGLDRCDLRGLRVEEIDARLAEALDRAAAGGGTALTIVHGLGSGALRGAVRRYLRESPYIDDFASAPDDAGGDGVTIAKMR